MEDHTEEELEASLKRAFVDGKADCVIIDSRRDRFLIESANLGMRKGWLKEKFCEIDWESSQLQYRLTDEGKKHFGIAR